MGEGETEITKVIIDIMTFIPPSLSHMKVIIAYFISIFGIPELIVTSLKEFVNMLISNNGNKKSQYMNKRVHLIFDAFFSQENILKLQDLMRSYIRTVRNNLGKDTGEEMADIIEFFKTNIRDMSTRIAKSL